MHQYINKHGTGIWHPLIFQKRSEIYAVLVSVGSLSHKHLIARFYIFLCAKDVSVCAKMAHCTVFPILLSSDSGWISYSFLSQVSVYRRYYRSKVLQNLKLYCRLHLEWDNFHWFLNTSSKGRFSSGPVRFQIKICPFCTHVLHIHSSKSFPGEFHRLPSPWLRKK